MGLSNNCPLLWFVASPSFKSLLAAYDSNHGFLSFNVFQELKEVDGKRPPSILDSCCEFNHYRLTKFILADMYPPCITDGSIIEYATGSMEGTLFRNKKDSVNALYWHIILHVSTKKRRTDWALNLLGDQVRVGLQLSIHCGVPNIFAVLERGRSTSEIVVTYNNNKNIIKALHYIFLQE